MNITEFVIDNCVRQSATEPKDYIGMTRACEYGLSLTNRFIIDQPVRLAPINVGDIFKLGQLVNSIDDINWRNVTARFNNGNEGAAPSTIGRLINQLLDMQTILTPDEFYWEFERIHPFVDGNGRVGAILHNVLTGDFWTNPPEMTW